MGQSRSPQAASVSQAFSAAELTALGMRLLAYAHRYARSASLTVGTRDGSVDAESIEDLVQDCILLLIEPNPRRHWDVEGYPDPFDFLKGAFNSMLYHARHRGVIHEQKQGFAGALVDAETYSTPENLLMAQELLRIGKEANDQVLVELSCNAQLREMYGLIENGIEKPSEIAESMNISVQKVYNLAKRLERKVTKVVLQMRTKLDLRGESNG